MNPLIETFEIRGTGPVVLTDVVALRSITLYDPAAHYGADCVLRCHRLKKGGHFDSPGSTPENIKVSYAFSLVFIFHVAFK